MGVVDKRSRLSIDMPAEERILLKMWATSQNSSINDFVLSCIRAHMPCATEHVPNEETARDLDESKKDNEVISFDSPLKMFKYLGLPTTCLNKNFQKNSKKTLKKRDVKKKI